MAGRVRPVGQSRLVFLGRSFFFWGLTFGSSLTGVSRPVHTARLKVLFVLCIAFGVLPQPDGVAQTGGPAPVASDAPWASETVPGVSPRAGSADGSSPTGGPPIARAPAERPPGDKPIIWLGGGLGFGTGGGSGQALAGHLEFALHGEGPNVYMARAALVTDILYTHGRDLSLLYGRTTGQAAALAGIGYTEYDNGDGSTSTAGLALQGRLRFGTLGPWGLGLTAFANVNPNSPFGGLALTLELGNV